MARVLVEGIFIFYPKLALSEPLTPVLMSVNHGLPSEEAEVPVLWQKLELNRYLAPLSLKVISMFVMI